MAAVPSKTELQPLTRFTDRVEDYVRYRPDYPAAVFESLAQRAGLGPRSIVADVGSGTGIFTRQLLDRGATVFAVEPNAAMRHAAEAQLGTVPRYISIEGTSTATGLPDSTISLITSAQAFHWFDPLPARREFWRISRPTAQWALVWNTTRSSRDAFHQEYERVKLTYGTDVLAVSHQAREPRKQFDVFFGAGRWERLTFPHSQWLDRDGLKGRMLSSSYAPKAGNPNYEPMIAALDQLFDRSQQDGRVKMEYETELFLGRPLGPA